MKFLIASIIPAVVVASRPFIEFPDTGFAEYVGNFTADELPDLEDIVSLNDFAYVAEQTWNASVWAGVRGGAAGEYSYRNNLEAFPRVRSRPRVLVDVSGIDQNMNTTIGGTNFSAPFYISPFALAGRANEEGEFGLVDAAVAEDIWYFPAQAVSQDREEILSRRNDSKPIWQQLYLSNNATATQETITELEALGAQGFLWTIDSAGPGVRHRADRYGSGSADLNYEAFTWEYYDQIRNMTDLPVGLKGIQTVEDAVRAVEHEAPVIILSNHGGRNLDSSPSPLEIAFEIHLEAPEVFNQTEVWADGGVRYGTDVLKLLSLGVRAVGLGRPFFYALTYGAEGVVHAIQLLKEEIASDAAHLGVGSLAELTPQHFRWPSDWYPVQETES